jgi:hypothetical protein
MVGTVPVPRVPRYSMVWYGIYTVNLKINKYLYLYMEDP